MTFMNTLIPSGGCIAEMTDGLQRGSMSRPTLHRYVCTVEHRADLKVYLHVCM